MVSISTYAGFLIAGLVIIAIFSIVGEFFQVETPVEKTAMTKSLPLEFSISKLRESKDVELPNMVLINGLLFGSNAMVYNITLPNDTENVELDFDVVRTNRYAPLVIKAGDFTESRKLPKGHYSFNLNGRESILVTIQPESSWWRIWAPALYELNNARATITAFKSENSKFSFNLDKELEGLESANLVLQFDKNRGNLVAELNGAILHSGAVTGIETLPINITTLGKENTLVFAAANNSQFEGRGTLVINYKG